MLRTSLYQRSMLEVDPDEIRLADDAFERHLPELVPKLVSAEDFREFYSEECGTGSRCPLMLTAMLLLQYRYQVSDAVLIERCRRDLGWRYAIGLGVGQQPPGQGTLQRHRRRLFEIKGSDFLHRCSLELAESEGFLDDTALQAVDSTNVDCRGAVIDTYNLIAAAIRAVVRSVARCLGRSPDALAHQWKLSRYMPRSFKGQVCIDWNDEAARSALITEEVQDADRLPTLVDELRVNLPPEVAEALELLARVAHQDVEEVDGGGYRIARGTAKGRIVSVTDPEARHGHKSSSKKFNGFKVHVAGTIASQFVTGIAITDGGVHDSHPTAELIEQTAKHGVKPNEAVGDAAYGTGANIRACKALGVAILAKQPVASHKDAIPKRAFDLDLEAMSATCPCGQTTTRVTKVKDGAGSGQLVPKFHFDKAACQACERKNDCCSQTRDGRNRTIQLSVYEAELRAAEAFNASPRAAEVLRSRSAIERLISHLVRMGMRHARFFGMHMVQAQAHLTAAAYNLQRYITLMVKRKRGQPT
jgi:IS5 family transposase